MKKQTGCFRWLREHGTTEGKLEALDFVNENYYEVTETLKKLKEETFS